MTSIVIAESPLVLLLRIYTILMILLFVSLVPRSLVPRPTPTSTSTSYGSQGENVTSAGKSIYIYTYMCVCVCVCMDAFVNISSTLFEVIKFDLDDH